MQLECQKIQLHTPELNLLIFVTIIHEATQKGLIKVHYCPTNKILADILTKPLSKARFRTHAYTPSLNMASTSRRSPRLAMKRTRLEAEMKSPTIRKVRACFGEAEK